ncbi:MAG: hypothetical protein WC822_01655 [Candidatus Paceibacterota bacterium]|jgi:hypothetical protein
MNIPAGSTLYVRRPGAVSRVIAWGTTGRREGPTLATHQGKFCAGEGVIHADKENGCVTRISWEDYHPQLITGGAEYAIISPMFYISLDEYQKYDELLLEMLGWKYNIWELPLQLADGLLAKMLRRPRQGWDAYVFRRFAKLWKTGVICSKTANRVDIKMGWKPDYLEFGSPDDSWDYDLAQTCAPGTQKWRLAYATAGWFGTTGQAQDIGCVGSTVW